MTAAAQSINGAADGTATHVVISDSVNSVIKAITTCAIPVQNGIAVPLNSYTVWEIRDPS